MKDLILTAKRRPVAVGVASAVAALALAAVANRYLARKAERENPPKGQFLEIDGVELHYIDRGSGESLVLLHGNGSMTQDFESSGLIEVASQKYRTIAFDRPGFGHSTRPRGTMWTAEEQADLFHRALIELGIRRATVLGHSWGASIAIALALKHPEMVSRVILVSGYYYPSVRFDVLLFSAPAVPVIGEVLSHTIAPVLARLIWPVLMKRIFGPAGVPSKFREFPREMALRPSQIRASAIETSLLIPNAFAFRRDYGSLEMPVTIIAGEEDRLVDTDVQSARLHRDVEGSAFWPVRNSGHMVHQTATAQIMAAIDEAVDKSAHEEPRARGYQPA